MVLFDNFRGAFRALASNKLRSMLTMLGIIIGVSAVISLLSIGQGVEKFINDQFNALGTNILFVLPKLSGSQSAQMVAQLGNQTTLTAADARVLADPLVVPDTAGTAPQIRVDGLARYGNQNLITSVRGVTPSFASECVACWAERRSGMCDKPRCSRCGRAKWRHARGESCLRADRIVEC